MQAMSTGFHCIACSLECNRAIALNAAPQDAQKNQVREHFNGKKHARAMRHVGADLLSEHSVRKFFGEILGQTTPVFSKYFTPVQAVEEYIKEHDGDVEWAMQHYAPPPPPLEDDWPQRGRRTKQVRKMIVSACHATWSGKGWAKMICCWDDATQESRCQRPDCRYNHASAMLAVHGAQVNEDDWRALFRICPCPMAAMRTGCKFHTDFNFDGWDIPIFRLAESLNEFLPQPVPPIEEELVPVYIAGKWVLQNKLFHERVSDSVLKFLNGREQDEIDE